MMYFLSEGQTQVDSPSKPKYSILDLRKLPSSRFEPSSGASEAVREIIGGFQEVFDSSP